ncbi:hypothetical protein, partial [Burkholderia gladioli]|uniref:hypothetical protein n=1 Tax=Burkholderia gladioli TaxID=28095 RepID=UPI001ABBA628
NMPTVITFVSPAQRLSRTFNHVGQNSMKITTLSGSVLREHQQARPAFSVVLCVASFFHVAERFADQQNAHWGLRGTRRPINERSLQTKLSQLLTKPRHLLSYQSRSRVIHDVFLGKSARFLAPSDIHQQSLGFIEQSAIDRRTGLNLFDR